MDFIPRTDLALEEREARADPQIDGVRFSETEINGYRVCDLSIETEKGADALCKPIGRYLTVELSPLISREERAFEDGAGVLASLISELVPRDGPVLVCGLGNPEITPDAVGHLAARSVIVTRHLVRELPSPFSGFRPVACLEPGVLGTTGVESSEIIKAVVERVEPCAVIAVDALASRRPERLCRTVQISDSGIVPGSGVGNARAALSEKTLGVPVIAVGVPTVVEAAALAFELAADSGASISEESLRSKGGGLIVTPRDIDAKVSDISKLVGYGLDLALNPGLTAADVDMLV